MKIKFFISIGLLLSMAVCIIGCASTGDGKAEPGILTIINIPAEFEGKYVSFSWDMGTNKRPQLIATATDPRGLFGGKHTAAVIKDGSATLMLFEDKPFIGLQAFTGSATIPVELRISDTPGTMYPTGSDRDGMPDFIFESVSIENGVAEIQWVNPIVPGVVTISGILDQYNDFATIGIGLNQYNVSLSSGNIGSGGYISGNIIFVSGYIQQGKSTTKIYKETRDKYMTYDFTGTQDIIISVPNGRNPSAIVVGVDPAFDYFLFRNVQITSGQIEINFNQGTKL
ncbi:MAG: hypothetical protein FWC03_07570 [Treponema sp.]|nr:hypothetical protein [Treponema sp.]